MRKWHYRYHGVPIFSEIRLPEWSSFETSEAPTAGAENSVGIFCREQGTEIEAVESEFRLTAKQAGSFSVRKGREIIFVPEVNANETRARAFLLGSAWGALMYQRGALLIHASAVQTGGSAVAFCARTGGGKSTLAATLCALGFPLVSDDLCCISETRSAVPHIYPSIPRVKLCEDAVGQLGWSVSNPENRRAGKFHYYRASPPSSNELPLHRIYLLSWGPPEIRRLGGFNALTRLTSAGTWRGDLLIATGDPATHFSRYADLLRRVECWEFRRPRELELLEESTRLLIRHISDSLVIGP